MSCIFIARLVLAYVLGLGVGAGVMFLDGSDEVKGIHFAASLLLSIGLAAVMLVGEVIYFVVAADFFGIPTGTLPYYFIVLGMATSSIVEFRRYLG